MAWNNGFAFPEYVSVAARRERARAAAEKLARKEKRILTPVGPLASNRLVTTFWGKAWCDNLTSYVDYANRLPRGKSYTRHGAVIDLQIANGKVTALVQGSSTYRVEVTIRALEPQGWEQIASQCVGQIDSLVDLLRGKLSSEVMQIVTRKDGGLFPTPKHISFACDCPDAAGLCKHVAATMYGVGVRLDHEPEWLFKLRGVDHTELVAGAADAVPRLVAGGKSRKVIKGADLTTLFGIEVEGVQPQASETAATKIAKAPKAKPKTPAKAPKNAKPAAPRKTAARSKA